jgi:hypothetical protein
MAPHWPSAVLDGMLPHMRVNGAAASSWTTSIVAAALVAGVPGAAWIVGTALDHPLAAQQAQTPQSPSSRAPFSGAAPAPSPLERLGPDLLRVGNVRIDTAKRELSVSGIVNDVQVLEFLANTKGGFKAYESALELDTNAVNFNVACLLIGLDTMRAVLSRFQFDPLSPQGDPVELFIEWDNGGTRRRIRAEQLIYNKVTKTTLTEGPWVYTGSAFLPQGNRYMAETDGTVIGFMHTPSPIVENPRPLVGEYGDHMINPELKLKAGATVQLVLRALPRTAAPQGK